MYEVPLISVVIFTAHVVHKHNWAPDAVKGNRAVDFFSPEAKPQKNCYYLSVKLKKKCSVTSYKATAELYNKGSFYFGK